VYQYSQILQKFLVVLSYNKSVGSWDFFFVSEFSMLNAFRKVDLSNWAGHSTTAVIPPQAPHPPPAISTCRSDTLQVSY